MEASQSSCETPSKGVSDQSSRRSDPSSQTPMERYLVKPFIGSSHHWALSILESVSRSDSVLDVGPGSGVMGEALKAQGVHQTFAVEIDESARAHVAPFYEQVEASIEPFVGRKFEWILLLDVLEHMSDPFDFLVKLDELMAPGAKALISVPNVAHWSVRFPLLFGFFEYTSRGILDRTHLQFFNRRRFLKLVHNVPGWHALDLNASIEPVEFVLPKWLWNNPVFRQLNLARHTVAKALPGLMAYQHLALVQKSPS